MSSGTGASAEYHIRMANLAPFTAEPSTLSGIPTNALEMLRRIPLLQPGADRQMAEDHLAAFEAAAALSRNILNLAEDAGDSQQQNTGLALIQTLDPAHSVRSEIELFHAGQRARKSELVKLRSERDEKEREGFASEHERLLFEGLGEQIAEIEEAIAASKRETTFAAIRARLESDSGDRNPDDLKEVLRLPYLGENPEACVRRTCRLCMHPDARRPLETSLTALVRQLKDMITRRNRGEFREFDDVKDLSERDRRRMLKNLEILTVIQAELAQRVREGTLKDEVGLVNYVRQRCRELGAWDTDISNVPGSAYVVKRSALPSAVPARAPSVAQSLQRAVAAAAPPAVPIVPSGARGSKDSSARAMRAHTHCECCTHEHDEDSAHDAQTEELVMFCRYAFAGDDEEVDVVIRAIFPSPSAPPPRPDDPVYRQKITEFLRELALLRAQIQKLLELGLIEPSQAAYGSPVVLAPKKDGTWRFCVDYRRLNQITERDVFPLPRIDDQLERLRGSMVFSTADATAGFWQLPLHPGSRAYTAFVVPWGHFQWRVTPFGVTNGPAAFSRAITAILGPLLTTCVVAYIDDITVFSPSIDQHLLDLKALFETISKANLRLKPSKCRFCVPEIDLLGHRISAEGIRQDPAKTKVISDWQTPKNADELRSFLGLAGYYRRFVENFSKVVYAMQRLLLKDAVWSWPEGGAADRAFKELKELLGRDIILRFPDFSKPFILQTDASTYAIGAILSQTDKDGVERPLAFISRTLLPAEMNYSATELECLAVVWAIKYWRHYLLGGPQFLVRTDHHALQWLKSLDPTTGRLGRWSLLLQAYDFEIVYRPGKQNGGPDACSRLPKDHPVWQPGGADGSSSTPAAYEGAEGFGVPQRAVGAEPEDPDVPLGIFRVQLGPTERALRKLADSAGFQGAAPANLGRSSRRRSRPPTDGPSPAAAPEETAGRSPYAEEESRPPEPAPASARTRRVPRELAKLAASAGYAGAKASAAASDDESRKRTRTAPERFAPQAPGSPSPPPAKRDRRPAAGSRDPDASSDSDSPMPDALADGDDGVPPSLLENAHAEAAAAESESEGSSEADPDVAPADQSEVPEPIHLDWEPEPVEREPPPGPSRRRSLSPETARNQMRAPDSEVVSVETLAPRRWVELDPRAGGGLWNEFFKEKGTRFVHAAAYHHATNGGAERLGGVYKTLAYAMCREHKRPLSDWPMYNADIVLALRTTVHSATGFSPMVLHRGVDVHLPCEPTTSSL
eukprot:tig00020943_g16302.t1